MKIENIKNEDIPRCVEIYNYYIINTCHTLEEEPISEEIFKNRVETISKKYPYIVYKDDNNFVLGYAYVHAFHERSAFKKSVELSIYVDKDHLHEHIGQSLFDKMMELVKKQGFTNVISVVTEENKKSISFHLKNGFILEGTLHNIAYKLNTDVSVCYLRKSV
jgi:L-amino acid N-acyltransferase YncA